MIPVGTDVRVRALFILEEPGSLSLYLQTKYTIHSVKNTQYIVWKIHNLHSNVNEIKK